MGSSQTRLNNLSNNEICPLSNAIMPPSFSVQNNKTTLHSAKISTNQKRKKSLSPITSENNCVEILNGDIPNIDFSQNGINNNNNFSSPTKSASPSCYTVESTSLLNNSKNKLNSGSSISSESTKVFNLSLCKRHSSPTHSNSSNTELMLIDFEKIPSQQNLSENKASSNISEKTGNKDQKETKSVTITSLHSNNQDHNDFVDPQVKEMEKVNEWLNKSMDYLNPYNMKPKKISTVQDKTHNIVSNKTDSVPDNVSNISSKTIPDNEGIFSSPTLSETIFDVSHTKSDLEEKKGPMACIHLHFHVHSPEKCKL